MRWFIYLLMKEFLVGQLVAEILPIFGEAHFDVILHSQEPSIHIWLNFYHL